MKFSRFSSVYLLIIGLLIGGVIGVLIGARNVLPIAIPTKEKVGNENSAEITREQLDQLLQSQLAKFVIGRRDKADAFRDIAFSPRYLGVADRDCRSRYFFSGMAI
jgi:hypothetical protein